jgi:hypothetical protein
MELLLALATQVVVVLIKMHQHTLPLQVQVALDLSVVTVPDLVVAAVVVLVARALHAVQQVMHLQVVLA